MKDLIEEIQQDIRDLRDSDSHVCAHDVAQKTIAEDLSMDGFICTCGEYDEVIDKLDTLKQTEV